MLILNTYYYYKLSSFHYRILKKQVILALKGWVLLKIGVDYQRSFILPKKSKKFTVIKSPFIYKKARNQFVCTRYQLIFYIKISKYSNIFVQFFETKIKNYLFFFGNLKLKRYYQVSLPTSM